MKKIIYFLIGFLIGALLSISIAYLSAYILNSLGIITYQSEFDQQRNFNIFVIGALFLSLVCGFCSVKWLTRQSK